MSNTIRQDVPVKDHYIKVYLKGLAPIDLNVVCDETEIADRVREYADYIISDVIVQVKHQLKDIKVGNGIVVTDSHGIF